MARTRSNVGVPAPEQQSSGDLSSVEGSPEPVVKKERDAPSRSPSQEADVSDQEEASPAPSPTAPKPRTKSTSKTRPADRSPTKARDPIRANKNNTRRKTITFVDRDGSDEQDSDTMVEGETSEQEETRTKQSRKEQVRTRTLAGNGRALLPNFIIALLAVLLVVNIPQCRDFLWPHNSAEAEYERSLEAQIDTLERLFEQAPVRRNKAPPEQPIFTLEDLTFLFYPNLYHVLGLEAPPYPAGHHFHKEISDTKPDPVQASKSNFEWARHKSCIRLDNVWNIWKFEGRVMKYHLWWYDKHPGARERGEAPPLLYESKIPGTEMEYNLFDKPHTIVRLACQILARMDTKWEYDKGALNLTKELERFAFNDVVKEAELMRELQQVKLNVHNLEARYLEDRKGLGY